MTAPVRSRFSARPSARKRRTIPAASRMWPVPAMPAIILLDSSPSTVRMPCQISMPDVRITPALYSQKNQPNSLLREREDLLEHEDDEEHDEAEGQQVGVREAELRGRTFGEAVELRELAEEESGEDSGGHVGERGDVEATHDCPFDVTLHCARRTREGDHPNG